MKYRFKIIGIGLIVIAAISTAAFTAHSLRLSATQMTSPAVAYTAEGEGIVNAQRVIQRFTLYSDGKGARVEIRTSFDPESGQQTHFEKTWLTSDKGSFRQKNNTAELYYMGAQPTTFPTPRYFRSQGREERQFFGLPAFLTRNDNPSAGSLFESWWSPDLGTIVQRTDGKGEQTLEIKLTTVQVGQPDPSIFVLPSLPIRYDDHDRFIQFLEGRGHKDAAENQRVAQQATRQKYGNFLKLD